VIMVVLVGALQPRCFSAILPWYAQRIVLSQRNGASPTVVARPLAASTGIKVVASIAMPV
jgi:hypothetical protein